MNFLLSLYNIFLYQPLFNLLILLYEIIPGRDFGIAIILLTGLVRLALLPLSIKAFQTQQAVFELQPEIQAIQEKYKQDPQELSRHMLELYRKQKLNPLSGLVLIFLQFPILIALYQVFQKGLHESQFALLYYFIPRPESIDPTFLGVFDVSRESNLIALLAMGSQLLQTQQAMRYTPRMRDKTEGTMQKVFLFGLSLITGSIVSQLPSAIGIYWIATNIFSVLQQWYLIRFLKEKK